MSKKEKKIIIIAQCLVNPYCRVHLLGQNFPFTHELISYLLDKRVGIVQYACPETTAMGLKRNPQGRQQYDNIFFRQHCKDLLKTPMLMINEFAYNNYKILGYIGLENSPTCGIHWGRHKVNKYGMESPNPVDNPSDNDPLLMGIMAEILYEELAKINLKIPFLEFPGKSDSDSAKRKNFWINLRKIVEPYAEQPSADTDNIDEDLD